MDIKFIQRCINDFLDEKYHNGIPNHMNYGAHIERCPKCGSVHFVKNGFDYNHKQKYRCKDCNTVFNATTGTMFSNSPVSFDTWRTFITGELNGLTLQQQSAATRFSVTTCFHMRHKLYAAVSNIQAQVVLSGNIEVDPAYTKINLKGTKPENMPRLSKHRGKHKSFFSKDIRGISGHKICVVTAIDENDNMLFKICGLGGESQEILEQFTDHFQKDSLIISDSKQAIINFALNNGMRSDSIPTSPTKTHFTTPLGNNLGSVNELHTEAKNMIHTKTWSRNQTPARISILDLIQEANPGLIRLMNIQCMRRYHLPVMKSDQRLCQLTCTRNIGHTTMASVHDQPMLRKERIKRTPTVLN